jgi:hypothetical protein
MITVGRFGAHSLLPPPAGFRTQFAMPLVGSGRDVEMCGWEMDGWIRVAAESIVTDKESRLERFRRRTAALARRCATTRRTSSDVKAHRRPPPRAGGPRQLPFDSLVAGAFSNPLTPADESAPTTLTRLRPPVCPSPEAYRPVLSDAPEFGGGEQTDLDQV